jgi:hypothetical protein
MAVKIVLDSSTARVIKTYRVEGADPIPVYRGSATTFTPRKVELWFVDGEHSSTTIYGPRTRKDGSDGAIEHNRGFYAFDTKEWPEWLQTLVKSATS